MQVKFTPEKLDPNEGVEGYKGKLLKDMYSGFIEIRMPSYPERLRFPKEIGIEVAAQDVDADKTEASVRASLSTLEVLAKCAEKVRDFIVSVDIKCADGTELKTIDDLYDYPDAGTLVSSLCSKFILGFLEKKV